MIYKSYILEQNLELIDNNKIFLFYGENQGMKKEFKENLKIKYKADETLNLFQEEIIKNKNLIFNEILNKSLFDEKKIIFINEASDKVLNILEEIIEDIKDEKIFLFADILDKKSKLRNFFEKNKDCGVAACYQDNEATIKKIIFDKLKNYQGLSPQLIALILQNVGLDRGKLYNEIEKIKSCFHDIKIDPSKLEQLLNIQTNTDFNELKDEAIKGNKVKTNRLLTDTIFENESNVYYLNAINQRMNKLNEIENLKQESANLELILQNLKPPIFWKDKPIIIEQSKKWSKDKINIALKKVYNTEIEIKSKPHIRPNLLIKNLIVDLCFTANIS